MVKQSPEVTANLVLGRSTNIPWEFSCENDGRLYRSIVPPLLTSGSSYALLQWVGLQDATYAMLYAPRMIMFLISLCLDWVVRDMFGERVHYVYHTSWVSVLLFSRPFSNVLESFLLTLCFFVASRRRSFLLGFITTAGLFNRITFPAFVLPAFWYFGIQQDNSFVSAYLKKRSKRPDCWVRFGNVVSRLALAFVGALVSFIIHVIADSVYAHYTPGCTRPLIEVNGVGIVLTPLNNLLYNSDVGNLSHHGLHPIYTHLLANMQIMFSPIWMFTMVFGSSEPTAVEVRHSLFETLKITCFIALLVLSMFPHQEARFLLPLLLPVAVITSDAVTTSKHTRFYWKLFNFLMVMFFGFMHQGGVVRGLFFVDKAFRRGIFGDRPPSCLATYETYMAPRALLGKTLERMDAIVDIGGGHDAASVKAALVGSSCPPGAEWLIMLPATALADLAPVISEATKVATFFPHVSMERLPTSFGDISKESLSMHIHRFYPSEL